MYIKGKDLEQISNMLIPYIDEFYKPVQELNFEPCLFSESYRLEYCEVENLIPERHRKFFRRDDWFNGASGIIEVGGEEKVLMLLANDDYSEALIFGVQEADEKDGYKATIIADFMESMSYQQNIKKEG